MGQRTCPIDGTIFTPQTANQVYCRQSCRNKAKNQSYRSELEGAVCARCGIVFERIRNGGRKVYCSDECHHEAKRVRYTGQFTKARASWPPAMTTRDVASYKRSLRLDPCAYCGTVPSAGVDHIEPTGRTGDRNDWTNMAGCCKRCNETKRSLTLLLALPWIPVSRTYHDQRRALFATAA